MTYSFLLWPGDGALQLKQLNYFMQKAYVYKQKNLINYKKIQNVPANDFFDFLGILIIAAPAGKGGKLLFESERERDRSGKRKLTQKVDYSSYMSKSRFDEIRTKFHYAFVDEMKKYSSNVETYDPWFSVSTFIKEFNKTNQGWLQHHQQRY
jgi:hypothetical protein